MATDEGAIAFTLTRSRRRRTMEICVADSREVRVTAPRYVSKQEIDEFILDKADWIRKKLQEAHRHSRISQKRQYADGCHFLFLGKEYPLEIIEEDRCLTKICFDGLTWKVRVPLSASLKDRPEAVKEKLVQWYRAQAKEIFCGRLFHYERMMGLESRKIVVKTQKRIWGSCDYKGKSIRLNWLLILSPLNIIDYVIVHELCHLSVPNHSKRFWQKVEKVLPDYTDRRKWLRVNALNMVLP